ncbi:alpha/beta hydrolase [Haloarcula salinisoli]|uniref:Alpha/beta hydrolase n=1 Tax=Haloarcula salinisoli TaxID=2487746 RepID=A0A8J7YJA8_9EURY|nr:alpha/beta hydrolase [Halomicroarcula salinisoli]MBX0286847.1 alpha/beta hydrolase [Halomicroarcula salinisoli]MBX0304149.1 alpha/beta hydrolase [Halomicroarcula salinisoli]
MTAIQTADGLELATAHRPAEGDARGTVLLAHGITQDMDEGGMFTRLAEGLAAAGFDAVRFSYRGHGDSDGLSRGVTIGGELLDFEAAFEHMRTCFDGPYFVVAKSFGAVSTSLSLERYRDDISGVVLWNPVLDIESTFLEPQAPWGREQFTGEQLTELEASGSLQLDGEFEFGRVLYEELHRFDPGSQFAERSMPALVVHGDDDDVVPYGPTMRVATESGADVHTIEDTGHAFQTPGGDPVYSDGERVQDRVTVEWLRGRAE